MFIVEVPYMNLDKIACTPQAFDWFKLWDGKYIICNGKDCVLVEQSFGDKIAFHCDEEEFFNVWYHYFGLSLDYFEISEKIRDVDSKLLSKIVDGSKGVRLLRRDPHDIALWQIIKENTDSKPMVDEIYSKVCLYMGTTKVVSVPTIGKQTQPLAPKPETILKYVDRLQMRIMNSKTRSTIIDYSAWLTEGNSLSDFVDKPLVDRPYWFTDSLQRTLYLYCVGDTNITMANDIKSYISLFLGADKDMWQSYYVQNLDPYAGIFCEWLRYYGRRQTGGLNR